MIRPTIETIVIEGLSEALLSHETHLPEVIWCHCGYSRPVIVA